MAIRSFKKILIVFSFFAVYLKAGAQDVQFSQFYAVPQFINPAYAGAAHFERGALQQRVQWPGLEAKYLTTLAAFEGYSKKYKSGFGAMALIDLQGPKRISSNEFHLQYAYETPVTEKITVRAGLQLGIVSRHIDFKRLDFPDQYTDKGLIGSTSEDFNFDRKIYPDIGSGVLVNTKNLWFSASAHHVNRPDVAVTQNSRLPVKWTLAGGYKFTFNNNVYSAGYHEELSVIPTFHYKTQGKSDQLDVGVYLNYRMLVAGLWYRGIPVKTYNSKLHNNESVVILAGFKFEYFKFGYSYDFITSRLVDASPLGAHELSLVYTFGPKKHKKIRKRLPCPKF